MNAEQVDFVRSLKGASASILITLILMRRNFQNKELELVTGYSDKPIKKGLALLELHGLVRNHGRQYGWALSDGLAQLELFSMAQVGDGAADEVGNIPTLMAGDGNAVVDNGRDKSEKFRSGECEVGEIPISDELSTGSKSEKFRFGGFEVGNIPTSTRSTRTGAHAPESSSTTSLHSTSQLTKGKKKKERSPQGRNRTISDFHQTHAPTDELKMLWHVLVRGGVGQFSKAMIQILEVRPSLAFVEQHVEARKHFQDRYPTGHMITKILNGEVPPAVRLSEVPTEFAHLVTR